MREPPTTITQAFKFVQRTSFTGGWQAKKAPPPRAEWYPGQGAPRYADRCYCYHCKVGRSPKLASVWAALSDEDRLDLLK